MGDEFENQFLQQKIYEEREKARKEGVSDPYTYTDPADGSLYEWDSDRAAWFPKVDDEFLANYHAHYGSHKLCVQEEEEDTKTINKTELFPKPRPPTSGPTPSTGKKTGRIHLKPGEKRKINNPEWFDVNETENRNVYVSGLPLDYTEEQFQQLMSKYGIIMEESESLHPKIKLYYDSEGNFKGDGRCCFLKVESVNLAIQLLDGSEVNGSYVNVERAQFQLKGQYDPSRKPKPKHKKKKSKQKEKHHQERLLDWRPEKKQESLTRKDKVIILKNMFHPKEFEDDATMITDIKDDIKMECEKFGEVKKVTVFDRHPDGVCSVAFKDWDSSNACVEKMNGRWFASKQIIAERWDGVTNYLIEETDREREERLKHWETFIGHETNTTTTTTPDVQTSTVKTPDTDTQHTQSDSTADIPSSTADIPPSTADIPPSTADIPSSTADIPSFIADIPSFIADIPSDTNSASDG